MAIGTMGKKCCPGECDDFDIVKFWRTENVTQGLINREWTTTDATLPSGDVDATIAYVDAFDFTSTPTVDAIVVSDAGDLNDTNSAAGVLDLQLREGYLRVSEPTFIRWRSTSEGSLLVDLGLCGADYKRVIAISAATAGEIISDVIELPVGVHKFRAINIDNGGVNSYFRLQLSADGVTFADTSDALDSMASVTPTNDVCVNVKICKPSGLTFDYETDTEIDVTELSTCPVECGAALPSTDSCLTPTGDVLCYDGGKARQYISCEDNAYTYLDTVTGDAVAAEDLVACEGEYNDFIDQTLCEIDAEYLLLISLIAC